MVNTGDSDPTLTETRIPWIIRCVGDDRQSSYVLANHIYKYVLVCENVLNFHGSDDCYYEEWYEDVCEEDGWICLINTLDHVEQEMKDTRLQYYINFGDLYSNLNWRAQKPQNVFKTVEAIVHGDVKRLV